MFSSTSCVARHERVLFTPETLVMMHVIQNNKACENLLLYIFKKYYLLFDSFEYVLIANESF